MFIDAPLSWRIRFTFCIGPFIMNACFIVFIGCSITLALHPLEARNAIALTCCFLIFVIDAIIVGFYGLIMGNWSELFYGIDSTFLSIALAISWPVFFLFYLPYVIYTLMVRWGSPKAVWEKAFGGCASIEYLKCGSASGGKVFVRYLYIGIPFGLFALLYIIAMVVLSPLWYFIIAPIGMGMYSICFSISFMSEDVRVTSVNDRVARTYRWGMFFNIIVSGLELLVSCCYLGLVASHWWAILLLITSGIYFLACIVPTIMWMCCGRSKAIDDLRQM